MKKMKFCIRAIVVLAILAFALTAAAEEGRPLPCNYSDPDPPQTLNFTETGATGGGSCGNGIDDDGDGFTDHADPDCVVPIMHTEDGTIAGGSCRDGIDNDGDGFTDGADPDCNIDINSRAPMCNWEVCQRIQGTITCLPDYFLKYYTSHNMRSRNTNITRAIVVVHGRRDTSWELDDPPADYYNAIKDAAIALGLQNETLIIAPYFPRAERCRPDPSDLRECEDSADNMDDNPLCQGASPTTPTANPDGRLCWDYGSVVNDYAGGGNAHFDIKLQQITDTSSFALMDDIINYLSNQAEPGRFFPNLKMIVVTGQSAGGQFTLRYAMAGREEPENVTIRYVPCNPGFVTYLSHTRPTKESRYRFPNLIGKSDCSGDGIIADVYDPNRGEDGSPTGGNCNDNVDNDSDGKSDRNDPECWWNEISQLPPFAIPTTGLGLEDWSKYPYSFEVPPSDFVYGNDNTCVSDGRYNNWPYGTGNVGNMSEFHYMQRRVKSASVIREQYMRRNVVLLNSIGDNEYVDANHTCMDNSEYDCKTAVQGQTRLERNALFFNHVCETYDCSNHGFAAVCIEHPNNLMVCPSQTGHGQQIYESRATREVIFNGAKPPSITYQRPLKTNGRPLLVSLDDLKNNFVPNSELLAEAGDGYSLRTVTRRIGSLRGRDLRRIRLLQIDPDRNFRGALFVPVRVRSPISPSVGNWTFISNRYSLRISDEMLDWLIPSVLPLTLD